MTSRLVTYDIPVHALVLKFLAYHYDTRPFMVTNLTNPYSSYLYACLDRYDHRDTQKPLKYARLTGRLSIGVATWRIKSFGSNNISPQKIAGFNGFVRQMFFEKLTNEVALHTGLGMGVKTATEKFLNRYGITEDELDITTALRYYGRQRRKMLLEFCPVLPGSGDVILSHERDCTDWQMESRRREVA